MPSLMVTTSDTLQGKNIQEYFGVVRGVVVRSPTITQGLMGGLKSIVGGKIGAFTTMCESARAEAYRLMEDHAQQLGANAIIAMRYDTGAVGTDGTEVICYGTAVRI